MTDDVMQMDAHTSGSNPNPVDQSPPRRRLRHWRRRFQQFLVVVIATVGVLEGVGRMIMGNLGLPAMQLHPGDGRCVGLKAGSAVDYTGWALRSKPVIHDVNRLGYRGEERKPDKQAGWSRIVFVGDSYVYGQGVTTEQALPAALERVLHHRGQQTEVMNFGVPGYNLEENVDQYRFFASKWQHDLLLVELFDNDLSRPFCDMTSQVLFSWLLKHLYSFRTAFLFWSVMFTRGHGSLDSPDGPAELEARLRSGLRQLDHSSRLEGARAALIVMRDSGINGLPANSVVEAYTAAQLPALHVARCTPDGHIPVVAGDGHFSPEGNRIVAECIADWLGSNKLLDRR